MYRSDVVPGLGGWGVLVTYIYAIRPFLFLTFIFCQQQYHHDIYNRVRVLGINNRVRVSGINKLAVSLGD